HLRRADSEQESQRGSALGLLPRSVGHAVRARVLPGRSGVREGARAGGVRSVTAEAVATVAASRRVADHLRAEILGGGIGPGERVREEDIAQRLGESRLQVREALRMLE